MMALSLRHLLLLVCAGSLIGCAGGPRRSERGPVAPSAAQQARAEQLAAAGYQPAESASLGLALQQWVLQGEAHALQLSYPVSGRRLPLIVYLPGLGETAQAGAVWRQAWARAGYAVLSLQPLGEDATAWSSDLARSVDFKGLARHHYQPALLQARLLTVNAALAEARQRATAGDSLWSRVDFDRMAVAGYELGAQTALALAPQFRAALALSPVAPAPELATGPGPLLLISSARDADPLGVVASPSLRQQWFDALPARGDQALLWLGSASHAALAGNLQAEPPQDFAGDSGRGASPQQQQPGRGGRQRGGGGSGERQRGGPPPAAALQASSVEANVAITTTSIAFFDAHLRQRPAARQWLAEGAAPWLDGLGEWRQR